MPADTTDLAAEWLLDQVFRRGRIYPFEAALYIRDHIDESLATTTKECVGNNIPI